MSIVASINEPAVHGRRSLRDAKSVRVTESAQKAGSEREAESLREASAAVVMSADAGTETATGAPANAATAAASGVSAAAAAKSGAFRRVAGKVVKGIGVGMLVLASLVFLFLAMVMNTLMYGAPAILVIGMLASIWTKNPTKTTPEHAAVTTAAPQGAGSE